MSSRTSFLVMRDSSTRSFSTSDPFLPMMMPGRAVWMMMRTWSAFRSISMRETPEW